MSDLAFSKNQRTIQLLARDILCREIGERLPSSIQYQDLLEVGSGTVQKGLRVLESVGAVSLRARGHQGTFLIDRHVGPLWAIAGLGPVTGALPLTDCTEGWGLAAGLREQFDLLGIPLQMLYLHGSSRRLGLVREGRADFAVLSQGARESARDGDADEQWVELDLGAHSYYSYASMVVLLRPHLAEVGPEVIRTVGIDRDSPDHIQLTLAEFPESEGCAYQPYDHPRLLAAVAERKIDAVVWHRTSLPIPLELAGIRVRALQQRAALDLLASLSRAVLLASDDKPELGAVLRHLDVPRIRDTQERVLRNEIAPIF